MAGIWFRLAANDMLIDLIGVSNNIATLHIFF